MYQQDKFFVLSLNFLFYHCIYCIRLLYLLCGFSAENVGDVCGEEYPDVPGRAWPDVGTCTAPGNRLEHGVCVNNMCTCIDGYTSGPDRKLCGKILHTTRTFRD